MTEEERKDYLKYIENYTINDLADIFNTQNFVIQDKDKFNEILLYYHFKQNEEIEQLQQENKHLKEHIEKEIDKAIKLIEDTYYSKNTTDIDSIVLSSDKLIKVREILKEVK